ncbi:MAG: response regulator [Defluviitaleaceae bacterium]|nr:response regulator [Defluviitaleaceae bacterium]MCL2239228.1 response regulator [Defluviitaleaceae bacterium]
MSKPVIAVVDDQSFICDMVSRILKDDYEVHTFTRGESMLKYMETRDVDLFLLDYDMPEKTGYECLLGIRSSKLNKAKPTVFLTAETNQRMREEMIGRGADDYLVKPLDAIKLRECIKKHLLALRRDDGHA